VEFGFLGILASALEALRLGLADGKTIHNLMPNTRYEQLEYTSDM
jgi:hypothetical protein